jgi:cell division transport system permease protein
VTTAAARTTGTRTVLDEARGVRAMTGVIAIMLFLTLLAAALGLATARAAGTLDRQLAGRLTVQIAPGTGDPARVAAALAGLAEARRVRRVPAAELARLLAPWLGSDAEDPDLPVSALIDVDLHDAAPATALAVVRAVHAVAPAARVDRHAEWMVPVAGLLSALTWLAGGLVVLMVAATASVVVLAARAGLDAHRATIEVMHMLGSTDVQVARLFQRRIARDAALGGLAGAVAALAVIAFLGGRLASLGSELLGGAALGTGDWVLLALLPVAFVALAAVSARLAVIRALRRIL